MPQHISETIGKASTLFSAMDIADVAQSMGKDVDLVTKLYFRLGAKLGLHWFLEQITNQPVGNHWQALARASYREELDWQQRALTSAVLKFNKDSNDDEAMFDNWLAEFNGIIGRWEQMLAEFKTSDSHEFAKFSVALRELMMLSHFSD